MLRSGLKISGREHSYRKLFAIPWSHQNISLWIQMLERRSGSHVSVDLGIDDNSSDITRLCSSARHIAVSSSNLAAGLD